MANGENVYWKRVLALPTVKFAKLPQINSAKMIRANIWHDLAHIPSTLPYKCPIKCCAGSSMLGLLHQFPFLNCTGYQML